MKSSNRGKIRIGFSLAIGISLVAFWAGCDSDSSGPLGTRFDYAISSFAEIQTANSGSTGSGTETRTRFSARVGPQPWPSDLPKVWPQPREATVVATGHRGEGERLILVNWMGKAESALSFYEQALESIGYAVERPRALRIRHALHAQGKSDEVVLTFIERDNHTRIEILFLAPIDQSLG